MSSESSDGWGDSIVASSNQPDPVLDQPCQEKLPIKDDELQNGAERSDPTCASVKVSEYDRQLSPVADESPAAPASSTKGTPKVTVTAEGALKETDDSGFVYYKCRFCGLTFNYMTTLKAHERVHNVEQPYVCPKCNCTFHYNCELEYHMQQHIEQKGYKCECGRTFYRYTDLLYHKHRGEDDNMDETPVEARPMRTASQSAVSQCSRAPPDNQSTPDFAERGFEPKHPLKVYSEVRSKPYICQYCSKSYADSRGLAYHMYSHRGERTFNPRASRYLMGRTDYSYISPGVE
uniref:Zinc finger protein unc-98 n=1 Tax=Plectus sambesii TaxID=2011161 RepID=A0A914USH4_9BILA